MQYSVQTRWYYWLTKTLLENVRNSLRKQPSFFAHATRAGSEEGRLFSHAMIESSYFDLLVNIKHFFA